MEARALLCRRDRRHHHQFFSQETGSVEHKLLKKTVEHALLDKKHAHTHTHTLSNEPNRYALRFTRDLTNPSPRRPSTPCPSQRTHTNPHLLQRKKCPCCRCGFSLEQRPSSSGDDSSAPIATSRPRRLTEPRKRWADQMMNPGEQWARKVRAPVHSSAFVFLAMGRP